MASHIYTFDHGDPTKPIHVNGCRFNANTCKHTCYLHTWPTHVKQHMFYTLLRVVLGLWEFACVFIITFIEACLCCLAARSLTIWQSTDVSSLRPREKSRQKNKQHPCTSLSRVLCHHDATLHFLACINVWISIHAPLGTMLCGLRSHSLTEPMLACIYATNIMFKCFSQIVPSGALMTQVLSLKFPYGSFGAPPFAANK